MLEKLSNKSNMLRDLLDGPLSAIKSSFRKAISPKAGKARRLCASCGEFRKREINQRGRIPRAVRLRQELAANRAASVPPQPRTLRPP
jgi:hypothetical protein